MEHNRGGHETGENTDKHMESVGMTDDTWCSSVSFGASNAFEELYISL